MRDTFECVERGIMDSKIIDDALDFVKEVFSTDFSGHDYFHTLRVYKMAVRIAQEEGANQEIVDLAALLHDVDDIKLSPETHEHKDRAVGFLRQHVVEEATIQAICTAIDEVSFSGTDSVVPSTLEGMCVQDADRLDALGAVGIARAFAYGGSHGRSMYDPDELPTLNMSGEEYHSHKSTSLNHFYEKLFLLADMMNTRSGKELGKAREKYMHEYVDQFLDEWNGKR